MNKRSVSNMATSVRQRLTNLAKERGVAFQALSQHYALERWLYRLSQSKHKGRFTLKGALMLRAWDIPASRPTRDIDLLGRTSNDLEEVRELIAQICDTEVKDDGMAFDSSSVKTERIAKDADYKGVRAEFQGILGKTRCPMQVDIGFSDVVTPAAVEIDDPTLLDFPAPRLAAYNRETAIAEKLEAAVKLGEINSRVKDLYDIGALAKNGAFEGVALQAAIKATFTQRGTALDPAAVCFKESYATDPNKVKQWKAFVKRSALKDAPQTFEEMWKDVMTFVRPVVEATAADSIFTEHWPAGGPWKIEEPVDGQDESP